MDSTSEEKNQTRKGVRKNETADSDTSSTELNSEMEEKFETESNGKKEPWELPDLFIDKNFYIYGNFDAKQIKLLNRIIIAFGG